MCGLRVDLADDAVPGIGLGDLTRETLMHGSGTDDEKVVPGRKPGGDCIQEAGEMLEAVRLAGGLRNPTAAVAECGVMPDMAGGPVMRRHVGLDALKSRSTVHPTHEDGLTRIDPDQGDGHAAARCRLRGRSPHDCAHAGRSSAAPARSA
ncbi:MAG TPA: hypothetical protein VH720_13840 [Candidatus Limnocylindrales bacterium]